MFSEFSVIHSSSIESGGSQVGTGPGAGSGSPECQKWERMEVPGGDPSSTQSASAGGQVVTTGSHRERKCHIDPKCLKLRMLPVGYRYFMHTQMNKAVRSALYEVDQYAKTIHRRLFTIHQGISH
ncbi:hypothetical protein Q8A73_010067 [Channa argus]|nr:hypothetical protein Q8A73_010067 [Channa argus]